MAAHEGAWRIAFAIYAIIGAVVLLGAGEWLAWVSLHDWRLCGLVAIYGAGELIAGYLVGLQS